MNFDDLWPFDEWMETKRTTISLKLIWIISLLNISRFDQSRKRTEREMMKLVNNLMLACAKWQLSRVEPAFNGLFKFISSASTECPCFMPRIVDNFLHMFDQCDECLSLITLLLLVGKKFIKPSAEMMENIKTETFLNACEDLNHRIRWRVEAKAGWQNAKYKWWKTFFSLQFFQCTVMMHWN